MNSPTTSTIDVFLCERARLKGVVASLGLDGSDADDILQDVFVKASGHGSGLVDQADQLRWLMRVTVNRCLLEFRHRGRFRRAASEVLQRSRTKTTVGPSQIAIQAEEVEMVRDALKKLDQTLLVPLVLCYFSDMDSSQIGQILELPASTVRSRLKRARLALARVLMDKGLTS